MGEAAGGGTRRRKKGGEGTGGGSGQKREEGNPGQSVPGVTGAQVPAPRGMWYNRGPHGGPSRPQVGPSAPLGAGRILPSLCWAGALRGWARQHPALPMPHPKPTHIPQFLARAPGPCQPGQGAALVPAPSGQGDQGDRAGLRGGGQRGGAVGTERGRRREGASAGKSLAPPLA